MRTIRPLSNLVYVEIVDQKKKFKGLTIVDAKYKDEAKCLLAKVLSVGELVQDVMVGDLVLISGSTGKWVDKPLTEPQDTERFLAESDVLALVTPKNRSKHNEAA